MKYLALATDYDGTIACDGTVDDDTAFALQGARSAGLSLILVTGRELADLFNTFPHARLFDRIVAENGAVLYEIACRADDSESRAAGGPGSGQRASACAHPAVSGSFDRGHLYPARTRRVRCDSRS